MTPIPHQPRTSPVRRPALAVALLGAVCLAGGSFAYGQAGGFAYDPAQLPETKGTLKQYTLTPRGDVDGLILQDGTEVKVPPHLSAQIVFAVRPGDAISVKGLKARALPLIQASLVKNETSGATVIDDGGPRADRDRTESLVTGRISTLLHGPRGEANGVVLESGVTVRLPPPEAERWASLLQQGQTISVRGTVNATLLGQVMEARAVGATPDQLSYLAPARGPKGDRGYDEKPPKGPREAREDREDKPPKRQREARDDRSPARPSVFAPPPPPAFDPPPAPPAAGTDAVVPVPPGTGPASPPPARP